MRSIGNRLVGVLTVLTAMGVVLPASAQVTFKKLVPQNTKIVLNVDTLTEQTLTLAGQAIESKSEQNAVQSKKFSPAEGGNTAIAHKVDSVQMRLKASGMDFSFDSVNPDKGTDSEIGKQIAKSVQATLKGEWTAVVDRTGKVIAIQGVEKLTEGLDEASAALIKSQLNPDALKDRLNGEADRIPTTPLKVGDTWEQSQNLPIGGGQTLKFQRKYKYAGPVSPQERSRHRIEVTATEVSYAIGADSPLPLKLKSSDLKVVESKGELQFDIMLGRVVAETDKVRMKGKLTFEIGGQELPGELDLTITTSQKERP